MSDYEERYASDLAPKVEFNGMAGDFFLLQLGNLGLSIVTLGIYRFWGKTRWRRFLWRHTSLDGDALEYRGTGLELLIGAILVILLITIPFGLLSLVMTALVGDPQVAIAVTQGVLLLAITWLVSVGQYRSWRYIFSRSSWRGIRCGMTEQGFAFGTWMFGLSLVQMLSLGLASPWVATKRWNRLVRDVRIGNLAMEADAEPGPLWARFLFVWGAVVLPMAAFAAWFAYRYGSNFADPGAAPPDPTELLIAIGVLYLGILVFGLLGALLFAQYQAAYWRETFGKTRIGETMTLRMDVTSWEVVRFYLGNIALVVFTGGIGAMLLPYRNWAFMARRVWIDGTYDARDLLQSDLAAPRQGDGIADAFDASGF
jgi:uncharacterized membrane protein YjgN (DUF898 family)